MKAESDQGKQNEKGFTLVEILATIAIMAIAILGIMALMPSGYKEITNAGQLSTMNHLGQMKLDQLRIEGVSHPDLTNGIHPGSIPEWPMGASELYSIKWTVTDNVPAANMKSIQVEVGYDMYEADGTPVTESLNQRVYRFTTYITN